MFFHLLTQAPCFCILPAQATNRQSRVNPYNDFDYPTRTITAKYVPEQQMLYFKGNIAASNQLKCYNLLTAENDQATVGFYAKPVSIGDFQKHCVQRRKYPVLLKLEFNNAIKETEVQPTRAAARKGNIEKNQNPRIVPCKPTTTTFSIYLLYLNRNDLSSNAGC